MRHNVYYVYIHYTKECPVPFYVGVGKQEAINKPIKDGRLVTQSELLRRYFYDKDLLESRIIIPELLRNKAEIIANDVLCAAKRLNGCPFQLDTYNYGQEVIQQHISNYLPHLLTYDLPLVSYYEKFTRSTLLKYNRMKRANERINVYRGITTPVPRVQAIGDPWAPYKD